MKVNPNYLGRLFTEQRIKVMRRDNKQNKFHPWKKEKGQQYCQRCGSVALAVKEIGIIEIKEQAGIQIHMTYAQYQEYGNFLKEHNLIELETNFTEKVDTMIFIDKEKKDGIKADLIEFFNGKVTLTDKGLREVEVPVNLS